MTEELVWRMSQTGRVAHLIVSGSALCGDDGEFGAKWRVVPGAADECEACARAVACCRLHSASCGDVDVCCDQCEGPR
jgi:hypothetical protein